MKYLLITIAMILSMMQCKPASNSADAYAHVSGGETSQLILDNTDLIMLDVRTPEEHDSGRIMGSININYFDEDFKEQIEKLDKTKHYLIYCRSGGRSTKAANMMVELGFEKLTHLDGGYKDYVEAAKK